MSDTPTVQLTSLLELIDAARQPVCEALDSADDQPELDFDEVRRLLRRALRLLGQDAISELCMSMRAALKVLEREIPAEPLPMTTPRLTCSILSERQVQQTKPT